jgi:hypothetical protein
MDTKIGCFIHSTNAPIWKDEMLISLIKTIQSNGLLDVLDFLFVSNIGAPLDERKICGMHPKIRVQNYSSDLSLFENVTLKTMHAFSKINPDHRLLYLHTKGVSHEKNSADIKGILSWNRYALCCVVEQYNACLQLLSVYDTIGCQFTNDYENPPHYSGNFWWATSKYISSLPVDVLKQKYDAEFWLMRNKPLFYNIFNLSYMYENDWCTSGYTSLVPYQMKSKIVYCKLEPSEIGLSDQLYSLVNCLIIANSFDCLTMVIVYGKSDDSDVLDYKQMNAFLEPYNVVLFSKDQVKLDICSVHFGLYDKKIVDVTHVVKERFFSCDNNQLIIPRGTNFNTFCEDPCSNEKKLIYVCYTLNGIEYKSVFDETIVRDMRPIQLDFKNYTHVGSNYSPDVWYLFTSIDKFPQKTPMFNLFLKNLKKHTIQDI